jgi:hypothetical protein
MAQTRKRRRRKHRGTQGGRIDRAPRARPRTRAEAQARARSGSKRRTPRGENPPTWRGATLRGLLMAAIFVVVLLVLGRPPAASIAFGVFILAFYIPMGFYIDRYMWRRRQRAKMRGET